MDWKEEFRDGLKRERAQIQQGLKWLQTGKLDGSEVPSSGKLERRKGELIAQYFGILRELDRTIADLERAQ